MMMENTEFDYEEWYKQKSIKISRLAEHMSKLAIRRHDVEQTPEYLEVEREYIWEQHLKRFPPDFHDGEEDPAYLKRLFG